MPVVDGVVNGACPCTTVLVLLLRGRCLSLRGRCVDGACPCTTCLYYYYACRHLHLSYGGRPGGVVRCQGERGGSTASVSRLRKWPNGLDENGLHLPDLSIPSALLWKAALPAYAVTPTGRGHTVSSVGSRGLAMRRICSIDDDGLDCCNNCY